MMVTLPKLFNFNVHIHDTSPKTYTRIVALAHAWTNTHLATISLDLAMRKTIDTVMVIDTAHAYPAIPNARRNVA
jgi:hypothetical protein